MCYRKFDHSDVDTNMHIERYVCSNWLTHGGILILFFLASTTSSRTILTSWMAKSTKELMVFNQQTKELMWKYNKKVAREKERHQHGIKIDPNDFKVWTMCIQTFGSVHLYNYMGSKSKWKCVSQSNGSVCYDITILQESCSLDTCHLKCPYLDCHILYADICTRVNVLITLMATSASIFMDYVHGRLSPPTLSKVPQITVRNDDLGIRN